MGNVNKKELFYWLFIMMLSILLITLYLQIKENNKLRLDFEVYKVESELALEHLENYYENEINWLEDYYKMKIELLEKDTFNINQIINDLEDLMEWTIRYYEVEPQTIRDAMELTEYILWKDNLLYQRILNG